MNYMKCKYCGKLYVDHDINDHMNNCYPNWNDITGLMSCFSCGKLYSENSSLFTKSQLNKQQLARCQLCIKNKITNKYAKYIHDYKNMLANMDNTSLNKQLEYYIIHYTEIFDIEHIRKLLNNGANPNYIRQASSNNLNEFNVLLYDRNGFEKEDVDNYLQPITPLRLCVFFLSNCHNNEINYQQLYEIANLLVEFGSNKQDSYNYYKLLYGDIICNNLWKPIYDLIKS